MPFMDPNRSVKNRLPSVYPWISSYEVEGLKKYHRGFLSKA